MDRIEVHFCLCLGQHIELVLIARQFHKANAGVATLYRYSTLIVGKKRIIPLIVFERRDI